MIRKVTIELDKTSVTKIEIYHETEQVHVYRYDGMPALVCSLGDFVGVLERVASDKSKNGS